MLMYVCVLSAMAIGCLFPREGESHASYETMDAVCCAGLLASVLCWFSELGSRFGIMKFLWHNWNMKLRAGVSHAKYRQTNWEQICSIWMGSRLKWWIDHKWLFFLWSKIERKFQLHYLWNEWSNHSTIDLKSKLCGSWILRSPKWLMICCFFVGDMRYE